MARVIDLFAGPGGLGEGFSNIINDNNEREFRIVLSIEKEYFAHQTLMLRSFYRNFNLGEVPEEYYMLLRGEIPLVELYERWPEQYNAARQEAWLAKLGEGEKSVKPEEIDIQIRQALDGEENWLLIGGPPCQAYSVVGRSRRREKILDSRKDEKVELYKQYLRILAVHNPAVFIMENVKGLLSAKTKDTNIFDRILEDLKNPVQAYEMEYGMNNRLLVCPGYKIYSLVTVPHNNATEQNPIFNHQDFIIKAENYGIPQTRHRVILLGIRRDIEIIPNILQRQNRIPISHVLHGLPRLRSGLSQIQDSNNNWLNVIRKIINENWLNEILPEVKQELIKQLNRVRIPRNGVGSEYITNRHIMTLYQPDWFIDDHIHGACNHESRGHMESDLYRYFFSSCFARVYHRSPKLEDFPHQLLPNHNNVQEGINEKKFADRFRVQLSDRPSKTVTSHISKDGHYYIHPDPTQCRSFTVREAARIQTFPDNYFFCGPRTEQFIQVGNAVPPLLAYKIAMIVKNIFIRFQNLNN